MLAGEAIEVCGESESPGSYLQSGVSHPTGPTKTPTPKIMGISRLLTLPMVCECSKRTIRKSLCPQRLSYARQRGLHPISLSCTSPHFRRAASMLNKNQLIESIRQINRTAKAEWLSMFDISSLRHYLDNLQRTIEPRGTDSRWIRLGETPPIIGRHVRG
jgi:hypothetical protein